MGTILDEVFHKERKIYMDFNGTTPLAPEVESAISVSLKEDWGNPNTSHKLGRHSRSRIDAAKLQVASLVNGNPDEIVFTSGGTEANNMVIMGVCQRKRAEKASPRHVVTTNVEHDSVIEPLKFLQETQDLQITQVDVSDYNSIADQVIGAIKENTVLITVMAANNETGVIMPLRSIGRKLDEINRARNKRKRRRIIFHSDAAQIIGKEFVDVRDWKIDCLTIVGHKFYGPRIGALWTQISIPPLLFGGGSKVRPGTENTPMIVGLGAAASLVSANLSKYRQNMDDARKHMEDRLQSLPVAVKINCDNMPRLVNTCNASFRIPAPFSGKDILSRCRYILAGVGAACHSGTSEASRILINSGVSHAEAKTSIRFSLGRDNKFYMTDEIIDDLSQAISAILWESLSGSGNFNKY